MEATRAAGDRETLFWSERGAVACGRHTPYRGSDTWVWERWTSITDADREAWTQQLDTPPECETCRQETMREKSR